MMATAVASRTAVASGTAVASSTAVASGTAVASLTAVASGTAVASLTAVPLNFFLLFFLNQFLLLLFYSLINLIKICTYSLFLIFIFPCLSRLYYLTLQIVCGSLMMFIFHLL